MTLKSLEALQTIAAQPDWYVVTVNWNDDAALFAASPETIDLWLEPIIGWRLDFSQEAQNATDPDSGGYPVGPGVTPITVDGYEEAGASYVLRAPDGRIIVQDDTAFMTEADARPNLLRREQEKRRKQIAEHARRG